VHDQPGNVRSGIVGWPKDLFTKFQEFIGILYHEVRHDGEIIVRIFIIFYFFKSRKRRRLKLEKKDIFKVDGAGLEIFDQIAVNLSYKVLTT